MTLSSQTTQITPPSFIGIGKALVDNVLAVPQYQRSYAWEEEHVAELFQDIATAMNDNEDMYFLGSIVTVQTEQEKLQVIDGQQRLATITILLAAIRDYFHEKADEEGKNHVQRQFLYSLNIKTREKEQKLSLNPSDNDFFRRRVLSEPGSDDRSLVSSKPAHQRIADAAEIAEARVRKIVQDTKEPLAKLGEWVDYIENRVCIIWFRVSSEANAFVIFETLNDRGLELTLADLLKNYLFSRSGNRLQETEQSWLVLLNTFESAGREDLLVKYINSYWASRFGLTRERELYDQIKKKFVAKNEVVVFTGNLASSSRAYIAMLSPDHDYWSQFDENFGKYNVRACIRTLNTLRLEQYRPLLLAVLTKFKDEEIAKTLVMLVSWTVRFVIDGGGGGTLEKRYPQVASKISDDSVNTAEELFTEMQDIVPNDRQFQTAFSTVAVSRAYLSRYLLVGLETYKREGTDPELLPNDNTMAVNLEHILPDTPSANWANFTEEEHKAYRNRLGNLTLLGSKKNSKTKDEPFADKKKVYTASDFKITQDVAQYAQWTRAEIEKRQQDMAALAIKIWNAKPAKR